MIRKTLAAYALLLPMSVMAQSGGNPLVMPQAGATQEPTKVEVKAEELAQDQAPQVERVEPAPSAEKKSGGRQRASVLSSAGVSDRIKPAPGQLKLESGQNAVVGIAIAHLNRIITPFLEPTVKTTSTATTMVDGSIVYVATNLEEPIGLFIHEKESPESAISLTLMPAQIPPISTKVDLTGVTPVKPKVKELAARDAAEAYEEAHPYPQMISDLMKDLARGEVPEGFGFEELDGSHAFMPACNQWGLRTIPLQFMQGAEVSAIVAQVTNVGTQVIEVDESKCSAPHVRAVAAWPQTVLAPGESTELYLAVSTPVELNDRKRRPSVAGVMP